MRRLHSYVGPAILAFAFSLSGAQATAGEYNHRGFYLRLAGGGSYLNDTLQRDTNFEANYLGGGTAFTVWAAGSIMHGMVVGGGVTGTNVFDGQVENGPKGVNSTFIIAGPVWDYYLIPSQGFHLLVSGGFSMLAVDKYDDEQKGRVAIGFGGLFGAGYDWTLSENWGVGILGQLAYGQMKKDGISNDVLVPTLQAAFTYY